MSLIKAKERGIVVNISWLEWLGYLASVIVLISLLMSSIIKLRWINLVGGITFSIYGFLIGAYPVGFMNMAISFINIYYLITLYKSKEYFKILDFNNDSNYFHNFVDFYRVEIDKFIPDFVHEDKKFDVEFFVLRNIVPAGIFVGTKKGLDALEINLDFAIPLYRDLRIGNYIFEENKDYFKNQGYTRFISYSTKPKHTKYLLKMGFELSSESGENWYVKEV